MPDSEETEPPIVAASSNNAGLAITEFYPEWKQLLSQSISDPTELAVLFGLNVDETNAICEIYPARINPYYLSLIKARSDAVYNQCIPQIDELRDSVCTEDPLHEEPEHQQRKNVPLLITHRYPDRVLFRISNQCAMFCRFCTRKRKVGYPDQNPTWAEIEDALAYLRTHEEIRDVILSGGDPLMLDDELLKQILTEVFAIISTRSYGIVRIGTRIPCSLPQRITPQLCEMLKQFKPLYINTHFNHPSEITEESKKACAMLADAGIPLACQTVLLKGVNDKPGVMKELMQGLIAMRVRPYYIYQADPVKGTNHFRTTVETGLDIYKAIRGHTSGLCVPTLVIDAPGGGGKIPLLPEYLKEINENRVILQNYEGKLFEYKQVTNQPSSD